MAGSEVSTTNTGRPESGRSNHADLSIASSQNTLSDGLPASAEIGQSCERLRVLSDVLPPASSTISKIIRITDSPLLRFALDKELDSIATYFREFSDAWDKTKGAAAAELTRALDVSADLTHNERAAWSEYLSKKLSTQISVVPQHNLLKLLTPEANKTDEACLGHLVLERTRESQELQQKILLSDSIFASADLPTIKTLIAAVVAQSANTDKTTHRGLDSALLGAADLIIPKPFALNSSEGTLIQISQRARNFNNVLKALDEMSAVPPVPALQLAQASSPSTTNFPVDTNIVTACLLTEEHCAGRELRPGVEAYSVATRIAGTLKGLNQSSSVIIAGLMSLLPEAALTKVEANYPEQSAFCEAVALVRAVKKLNQVKFNPVLPIDPTLPDYTLQYSWDRLVQTVGSIAQKSGVDPADLLYVWGASRLEHLQTVIDKSDSKELKKSFDEIRFFVAPIFQRIGEGELAGKLLDTWAIAHPTDNRLIEHRKKEITGMDRPERQTYFEAKIRKIESVLQEEFGLAREDYALKFREKPNFSAWEKTADGVEQKQKARPSAYPGDIKNQTDLVSIELQLADWLQQDTFEKIKHNIHALAGLGKVVGIPHDRGTWMREAISSADTNSFHYEIQVGSMDRFRRTKLGGGAPRKAEEKHLHMKVKRSYDNYMRSELGISDTTDFAGAAFHHSDPQMEATLSDNFWKLHTALSERYVHVQVLSRSGAPALFNGEYAYEEHRLPKGSIAADVLLREKQKEFTGHRIEKVKFKSSYLSSNPTALTYTLESGDVLDLRSDSLESRISDNRQAILEFAKQLKSVGARLVAAELVGQSLEGAAEQGQRKLESEFGTLSTWHVRNICRPLQARSHLRSLEELYAAVGLGLLPIADIRKYHDDRYATIKVSSTARESDKDLTAARLPGEMLEVMIDSNAGGVVAEVMHKLRNFSLTPIEAVVTEGQAPGSKHLILDLVGTTDDDRQSLALKVRLLEESLSRDLVRPRVELPSFSGRHRRSVHALINSEQDDALLRLVERLNSLKTEVVEMKLHSSGELNTESGIYREVSIEIVGPGHYNNVSDQISRVQETRRLEQALEGLVPDDTLYSVSVKDITKRVLTPNISEIHKRS